MNYQINYSFLQAWLDANPQYTKKDILNALESTDYVTLNRWINGDRPMQPDAMCRFCNYFGVPLSCFFKDGDAIADVTPGKPSVNDQLEPNNGYPNGSKMRGQGGVNPTTEEHKTSVLPTQYATPRTQITLIEPQQDTDVSRNADILAMQHQIEIEQIKREYDRKISDMQMAHMKEVAQIHKEYNGLTHEERKYYMDVIVKLSANTAHTDGGNAMGFAAEDIRKG